jgi:hypothetical protein
MKGPFAALSAAVLCSSVVLVASANTLGDLIRIGPTGSRCGADRLEGGVILHQGGYVAEVQLAMPNGDKGTREVLFGQCAHLDSLTQFAGIKIFVHTGLVWEPKRLLYTGQLRGQGEGPCLSLSGTTLDPKIQVLRSNCLP